MTRPAWAQMGNLIRTVTAEIGNSVTALGVTAPIYHNYDWSDPEAVRRPSVAPEPAWVATTWLETLAGRQGSSLLQVDVFSRVGAPGSAYNDPYGLIANALADEIEALFAGRRPGGGNFFWIPVLDFTVDPNNPTDTGHCIVMQSSNGRNGMPESRASLGVQNGFQRVVTRLRFKLPRDMAVNAAYMTE